MELMPAAIAERMIALARREGLWRGILIGFVSGALCVAILIVSAT